ncbi:MAG: hypothetical protein ACK4ZS_05040 [Sulfurimicrobium sp.]
MTKAMKAINHGAHGEHGEFDKEIGFPVCPVVKKGFDQNEA